MSRDMRQELQSRINRGESLQAAYRKLSVTCHPDKFSMADDKEKLEASRNFAALNAAKDALEGGAPVAAGAAAGPTAEHIDMTVKKMYTRFTEQCVEIAKTRMSNIPVTAGMPNNFKTFTDQRSGMVMSSYNSHAVYGIASNPIFTFRHPDFGTIVLFEHTPSKPAPEYMPSSPNIRARILRSAISGSDVRIMSFPFEPYKSGSISSMWVARLHAFREQLSQVADNQVVIPEDIMLMRCSSTLVDRVIEVCKTTYQYSNPQKSFATLCEDEGHDTLYLHLYNTGTKTHDKFHIPLVNAIAAVSISLRQRTVEYNPINRTGTNNLEALKRKFAVVEVTTLLQSVFIRQCNDPQTCQLIASIVTTVSLMDEDKFLCFVLCGDKPDRRTTSSGEGYIDFKLRQEYRGCRLPSQENIRDLQELSSLLGIGVSARSNGEVAIRLEGPQSSPQIEPFILSGVLDENGTSLYYERFEVITYDEKQAYLFHHQVTDVGESDVIVTADGSVVFLGQKFDERHVRDMLIHFNVPVNLLTITDRSVLALAAGGFFPRPHLELEENPIDVLVRDCNTYLSDHNDRVATDSKNMAVTKLKEALEKYKRGNDAECKKIVYEALIDPVSSAAANDKMFNAFFAKSKVKKLHETAKKILDNSDPRWRDSFRPSGAAAGFTA